jgi:hypothetical protein
VGASSFPSLDESPGLFADEALYLYHHTTYCTIMQCNVRNNAACAIL